MNRLLKAFIGLLLTILVGVGMFFVGFAYNYIQVNRIQTSSTEVPSKFPLMWEAYRLLKQEFYGDIPAYPALVHGMIRGMLSSLEDPHTILVEPQPAQLEQHNLQGSYGGIGARVESHNGLLVLLPFSRGPAADAGVQPNDVIVQIDGKDITSDMTTDDLEIMLRGDVGSSVKVVLHRIGVDKPIELTLARAKIDIPTVEFRMLEKTTIAYVRVSFESSETAKEFESAINALKAKAPTGYILDLRNNPGGLFPDPVLSIAGQFIKSGTPVVFEKYRDGTEKTYGATGGGLGGSLPLVVLVNGGTASDAEILAGALQDNGRAKLIGDKTFGKGSVQSIHQLSDKSELHVTTATWYTPKHNQIEGDGLKPDLAIPLTPEDAAKGVDPQLDRAIQFISSGS